MSQSPPRQGFFRSQRLRISCWDWGNQGAPTLVLVHGGRDHARSWDRIAEAFRHDHHVLAPDLRGHGDSDWTPGGDYGLPGNALDLVRIIEEGGSPATVIGHSYGGSVSLIAAGTFPEHFRAVVAMEGTHSLNPPQYEALGPGWLRRWGERLREFEALAPRIYPDREAAAQRMREANPRLPPEFVPHLARYASREVEGGYVWKYDLWVNGRTSMELRRDELPAFWEAIKCPVLLLNGDDSRVHSRQHAAPERHIRSLQSAVIDGAGHWMHHDQPEAVIDRIRRFLAQSVPVP